MSRLAAHVQIWLFAAALSATLVLSGQSPLRAQIPLIRESVSCGTASVLILSRLATGQLEAGSLADESLQPQPDNQDSMLSVRDQAKELGLDLVGVKCTFTELAQLRVPAIAHMVDSHFLVIDGASGEYVRAFDGSLNPTVLTREDFQKKFSGYALVPAEAVKDRAASRQVWPENCIIDVGEVPANSRVTKSFLLRNEGPNAVTVLTTHTCCGSDVEMPTGVAIPPSMSSEVKLTCRVPGGDGVFTATAMLVTDLPSWPVINVTIRGEVSAPILPVPQIVNFGRVKKGSGAHCQVQLRHVRPEQAETMSFRSSGPFLRVEKVGYDAVERIMTLAVHLDPSNERGAIDEFITVQARYRGSETSLDLPVAAEVWDSFIVTPPKLAFGLVRKGTVSSCQVELKRRDNSSFSITDVRAPGGVGISYTKADNGYVIEAIIGSEAAFDIIDDVVTIITDSIADPEVRIPIYVALEP